MLFNREVFVLVNSDISDLLIKYGALYSSDFVKKLVDLNKYSDNAARQSISRAYKAGKIKRFGEFKYTKNRYIYVLNGNPSIHTKNRALFKIWKKYDPAVFRLLSILEVHSFLFEEEVLKILAVPVVNDGRKRTSNDILSSLAKVNIIDRNTFFDEERNNHTYYTLKKVFSVKSIKNFDDSDLQKRLNQIKLSMLVLRDSISFFSYFGFLGWHSEKVLDIDENLFFSKYSFDAYAASYMRGNFYFDKFSKKKGTTVLFSIILYRQYTLHDYEAFKKSIIDVESKYNEKNNIPKIIPVIICKSMDKTAFDDAKVNGYLVATIATIFGKRIENALNQVLISKTSDLIDASGEVKEILGQLNNLRGKLFQYLISRILVANIPGINLQFEKKYSYKRKDNQKLNCECDIVFDVINSDGVYNKYVFELKCFRDKTHISLGENCNEPNSVKKLFEKVKPIVEHNMQYGDNGSKSFVIPIFVTNTSFRQDAIDYMDNPNNFVKIKKEIQKDHILDNLTGGKLYIDKNRLEKLVSNNNMKDVRDTLAQINQ